MVVMVLVRRRTYTAGASWFLPMVKKKSDMSWKQSSSTVSTVSRGYQYGIGRRGDLPRSSGGGFDTSILFCPLVCADFVQLLDLLDDSLVKFHDILAADIGGAVLLEER